MPNTTVNTRDRAISDQWTLTGDPLTGGTPTLKLRTSHYKDRKALVATLSYIEVEDCGTYGVEKWQSDWPLVRVDILPIARYSPKALTEFREQVLQRVENADFNDARILDLIARIPSKETP